MPDQRQWIPLARLGAGSFGHVFLAMSATESSPMFAVKTSSSPSSSSARHILLHELQILQSLSSPYIIRCFGSDRDTSSIFLEYMDSGSVADLLQRHGNFPETQIRAIAVAILRGLAYMHSHGVAHCDIKGQNVLLASDGSVKIADFGSSKRIHGELESSEHDLHAQKQIPRGTPLWMAPEVIHGVSQGPACDIWSLGCTVVEMFQGRPPWASISELANAITTNVTTSPSLCLPNSVSPWAKDFLLRCFQIDPDARWSAEQLLLHPFVTCISDQTSETKQLFVQDLASPRSTLDNLGDTDSDFDDFEALPFMSFTAMASPPSCAKCIKKEQSCITEVDMEQSDNQQICMTDVIKEQANIKEQICITGIEKQTWTAVRGHSSFNRQHMPFMESFDTAKVVKGSHNVDLTSAGFLLNRNR